MCILTPLTYTSVYLGYVKLLFYRNLQLANMRHAYMCEMIGHKYMYLIFHSGNLSILLKSQS